MCKFINLQINVDNSISYLTIINYYEKYRYEIHKIMEDNRMVKKKIAEKAGMSDSELGQIRHYKDLKVSKLERLCKAIGVSPIYFFDDYDYDRARRLTGDIRNSSNSGNALVNLRNHTGNEEYLFKIIEHQEKLINALLAARGLDGVVSK